MASVGAASLETYLPNIRLPCELSQHSLAASSIDSLYLPIASKIRINKEVFSIILQLTYLKWSLL
jgi:hypothetical protein